MSDNARTRAGGAGGPVLGGGFRDGGAGTVLVGPAGPALDGLGGGGGGALPGVVGGGGTDLVGVCDGCKLFRGGIAGTGRKIADTGR